MASDCETNIKFVPCDDINAVDPSLGQFIIEGDKLYSILFPAPTTPWFFSTQTKRVP